MDIPKERPANADDTQQPVCTAITIAGCVLVFIVVILRYFGRWVLSHRVLGGKGKGEKVYGLDDIFNVLAVLTFYGLCISVFRAIRRGMGEHIDLLLYEHGVQGLVDYSQAIFFCALFYNTTLGMIKLSVLSLYVRILRGVQSPQLRITVWTVFAVVAANTTANVLVVVFQCWPLKAAWEIEIPANEKSCVDVNAFYLGNAITGVITDAVVYFLSVPIVKPLQMDGKTKLQLLATMLIGGFAVITSAVRLGFMPALLSDPDATMAMAVPMNWSVAEPAVGILVSSMPAIRAIRFLWRKPGQGSYGSSGPHSTQKSRTGHIQLYDIKNEVQEGDRKSRKTDEGDNDSEENLMIGSYGSKPGIGQISRTTELRVEHQAM